MRHRRGFSCLLSLWPRAALAVCTAALVSTGGHAAGDEGPPSSPEGLGVVKGVVVDEGGKPVLGARVRALRVSCYEPADPFKPALDLATDATGRFETRLPPGEYLASIAKGLLTAQDAPWRVRRWEVGPAKTLDLRICLRQGDRVEGIVVRKADGRPVVSASVALDSGLAATTDERGRFAIEGVGFERYDVGVRAPDLADREVEMCVAPKGDVRIEMRPGFTVQGRVTDEAGRPVAGARVGRLARSGGIDRTMAYARMGGTLTDAEGKYALPGLPRSGATLLIVVIHRDYAMARIEISPPRDGPAQTLDVKLADGFAIEGEVHGPDGRPVSGAAVKFGPYLDPHIRTQTDAKGFFRLAHVARDSEAEITVQAKGCPPVRQKVRPGRGGSVPRLSFALVAGKVAVGRVADPGGKPVAGAEVEALVPGAG